MLMGGQDAADRVLNRLGEAIERHRVASPHPYSLSLSVGVAVASSSDRPSLARLVSEADDRMYEDKRSRRAGRGPT
jgi:GGDEF domain-containing protein